MNHIALTLLMAATLACADSVTLQWDRNPEPDIAGYMIYWGLYPVLGSSQDCGNTNRGTITVVNTNVTRIAVTAYNTSGLESPHSNSVYYNTPPPGVMRVVLERSTNMTSWVPVNICTITNVVATSGVYRLQLVGVNPKPVVVLPQGFCLVLETNYKPATVKVTSPKGAEVFTSKIMSAPAPSPNLSPITPK